MRKGARSNLFGRHDGGRSGRFLPAIAVRLVCRDNIAFVEAGQSNGSRDFDTCRKGKLNEKKGAAKNGRSGRDTG